ncbi:MAG: hypothetical protein LBM98_10195, partial [Oscillospiraceae bacterium]|nr:hypothetical protein [Oscillospiraceae bacterium]
MRYVVSIAAKQSSAGGITYGLRIVEVLRQPWIASPRFINYVSQVRWRLRNDGGRIGGFNLRKRVYDIATLFGLGLLIVMLVVYPSEAVAAGKDGVMLCLNVIVPSLLPFFVVSALVVELGAADALGVLAAPVMRVLFNVSGTCGAAWIMGFIGGYPVGAKTAIALYNSGKIGKVETERLLSFCNNSGPAFILGVVGAGVFSSGRVGLLLYLVHALSSVLVGIGFRNYKRSVGATCGRPPGSASFIEPAENPRGRDRKSTRLN